MSAALIALLLYGLLSQPTGATLRDALGRGEAVELPAFELRILAPGRLSPELETALGPALRDGVLRSDELRGIPVVLNIWASWCGPCRDESPSLRAVWRDAAPLGALVLGLNQQDVRASARRFLADEGLTYPSVRDPTDATSKNLGAVGVPETFAIDVRGRIVGHRAGAISTETARALLRAARSGRVMP